jgi:hypothetical protein
MFYHTKVVLQVLASSSDTQMIVDETTDLLNGMICHIWRGEKYTTIFFEVTPKKRFLGCIFRATLAYALKTKGRNIGLLPKLNKLETYSYILGSNRTFHE